MMGLSLAVSMFLTVGDVNVEIIQKLNDTAFFRTSSHNLERNQKKIRRTPHLD
jgi:hypothetical protein